MTMTNDVLEQLNYLKLKSAYLVLCQDFGLHKYEKFN